MYGLELVTGPATEPVTAADAKLHARIDLAVEDDLVDQWIAAAREYAEEHCGRKWVEQTWKVTFSHWPRCPDPTTGLYALRLPWEPVSSITSVKYYDTNGVQQTLVEDTDYQTWLTHSPPLIAPAPNTVWPTVQTDKLDAIEVTFVAGYDTVPHRLKQAIYQTLTFWNENRGDGRDPSKGGLPDSVIRMLDSMWTGVY